MDIVFNVDYFTELLELPIHLAVWEIFIRGGWIVVLVLVVRTIYVNWIAKRRQAFLDSIEYSILAVDVPRENEQGPKAVEQIFAQLNSIESGPGDWREYYIDGIMKTPISLEIISMEGYIQFLIRVPKDYVDLAEAAIYSQYTDAEITEVQDYVEQMPLDYPSEEYELWGTELILQKDSAYPIKTYANFEDPTSEESFKDPMAAIMEVLSKIGMGEHIWMQILAVPAGDKWAEDARNLVKKMLGIGVESKVTIVDKILEAPLIFLRWVHTNLWGDGDGSSDDSKESRMSPGEVRAIGAIEDKIAKLGFETKFRIVYWAQQDVFSKGRGVAATIGAIKQFSTLNLNGFVPDKGAKTGGDGKNLFASQRKMAKAYLNRDFYTGSKPFVLNTEEMATIFHFPMFTVKAPLLQRAQMKVSEAPAVLPTESFEEENIPAIQEAGFEDEEFDDDIPEEMKEILNEDDSYIAQQDSTEEESPQKDKEQEDNLLKQPEPENFLENEFEQQETKEEEPKKEPEIKPTQKNQAKKEIKNTESDDSNIDNNIPSPPDNLPIA